LPSGCRHSRSTPGATLPVATLTVAAYCAQFSTALALATCCAEFSTTLALAARCAQLFAAMLSFTAVARNYLAVHTLCDCGKFAIFAWRLALREKGRISIDTD